MLVYSFVALGTKVHSIADGDVKENDTELVMGSRYGKTVLEHNIL